MKPKYIVALKGPNIALKGQPHALLILPFQGESYSWESDSQGVALG